VQVLIDTGVLYALSDTRDQYHQRAREEAERLERAGATLSVCYPTLLESYSLVLFRLGKHIAQRWLAEALQGLGTINASGDDYRAAQALVQRYPDQSITLFDAVLVVLAERLGFAIWTFDADFDIMRASVWRG
jgi:predicted nucleic acid-binding protein